MTDFVSKVADSIASGTIKKILEWLTDQLVVSRILQTPQTILFLASWVLMAATLWRMAGAAGLSHSWTACLPVGQARMLGRLSDACLIKNGRRARHTRRLTVCSVMLVVVMTLCKVVFDIFLKSTVGAFLDSAKAQEGELSAEAGAGYALSMIALVVLSVIIALLLMAVVAVFGFVLYIMHCVALWPVFKERSPRYAGLYEVLTVLCFPVGAGILLYLSFARTPSPDRITDKVGDHTPERITDGVQDKVPDNIPE